MRFRRLATTLLLATVPLLATPPVGATIGSSQLAADNLHWAQLTVIAQDLAYDPNLGMLYATTSHTDTSNPNSLLAIDPITLTLEWSLRLSVEPDAVETAKDGSKVFVGLNDEHSIAVIDANTHRLSDLIEMPVDSIAGGAFATDIAAAPGNPDTIAVALEYDNGWFGWVVIYDGTVPRPVVASPKLFSGSTDLTFGANAGVLYGQNTASSENGFRRMTVDADGVRVDDATEMFGRPIDYVGGRVYFQHGWVVDPTVPNVIGKFTADRLIEALAPLPSQGVALTISGTSSSWIDVVSIFDLGDFSLVDNATFEHQLSFSEGHGVAIDGIGLATIYREGILIIGDLPWARVEGQVVDSSTGAGIDEICVFTTDEHGGIATQVETGEDGSYEMSVPPGTWRFLFADCHYVDYFWEWHNDQVFYDFDLATPVTVNRGGTVTIDAELRRSFTDSLDSIFQEQIWWMYDTGITSGCGAEAYCPDSTVTRGQMAAFLVRALNLKATSSIDFIDDDASIFEGDINRLATAGITKGCNPPVNDRFCPMERVTRGQMAAFLNRALATKYTLVLPPTEPRPLRVPAPTPFGPMR